MSRIERDHDGLFTGAVLAQEETQTTFVLPCRYEGVGVLACNLYTFNGRQQHRALVAHLLKAQLLNLATLSRSAAT